MMESPSQPQSDLVDKEPTGGDAGIGLLVLLNRTHIRPLLFAAFSMLFAVGLSLHPSAGGDLFWQIRCGNDILAHGPPHIDTYSWLRHGTKWTVDEWLSFVLFALAYRVDGGLNGPLQLMELLVACIAGLMYLIVWIETRRAAMSFVITVIALNAMSIYLQPRPYLFSFIFFLIASWLVQRVLRLQLSALALNSLLPIFVLWANLHEGVVVGIAVVCLLAVSTFVEHQTKARVHPTPEQPEQLRVSLLTAGYSVLLLAATLVTPYGADLYRLIWVTLSNHIAMSIIMEWRPINGFFLSSVPPTMIICDLLLFSTCALCTFLYWKRAPLVASSAVVTVLMIYEAIQHNRNLPFAVIAATVLFSPLFGSLTVDAIGEPMRKWREIGRPGRSLAGAIVTVVLAGLCSVAVYANAIGRVERQHAASQDPREHNADVVFQLGSFCIDAADFMNYCRFPGNMRLYNDYDDGGLLILMRPSDRVFIDSRNDIYAGELLDNWLTLNNRWSSYPPDNKFAAQILDTFDFDCAVTRNPDAAFYFASRSDYQLVYVRYPGPMYSPGVFNCWIYVRSRPQYAGLIERCQTVWSQFHAGQLPESDM